MRLPWCSHRGCFLHEKAPVETEAFQNYKGKTL